MGMLIANRRKELAAKQQKVVVEFQPVTVTPLPKKRKRRKKLADGA